MKNLQYVVTGTGRCGTVYLANLLTSVSIPCGHESVFTPWGIEEARARLDGRLRIAASAFSQEALGDWLPEAGLVADSSYMAAPCLDDELLSGTRIIHAVRHPLRVINSFVIGLGYFLEPSATDGYHEFIFDHVPEMRQHWHPLERAALYYVRWNRMIEERTRGKACLLLRMEDGPSRLLRYVRAQPPDPRLLESRTINSRMEGKFSYGFADIPPGRVKDELADMADQYGYDLSSAGATRHPLWRNVRRLWKTLIRNS